MHLNTLSEVNPSPEVIKVSLPNLHVIRGLDEASIQSFLEGSWSWRKKAGFTASSKGSSYKVIKLLIIKHYMIFKNGHDDRL